MASDLTSTFAQSLRRAREARHLTQAEAAELTGLAVEAYGRLERGSILPRAATLVSLSRAFGVSTDSLLGLSPGAVSAIGAGQGGNRVGAAERPELVRLRRRLERLTPKTLRLLAQLLADLAR